MDKNIYYLVVEARPKEFMPIDINILLKSNMNISSIEIIDSFTKEYTYDELQSLTLANAKKRKAVLTFDDNTYTVPLASEKQGDKLASFLKRKNNSIKLDGFNEIALNQLHDIDASV